MCWILNRAGTMQSHFKSMCRRCHFQAMHRAGFHSNNTTQAKHCTDHAQGDKVKTSHDEKHAWQSMLRDKI